MTPHHTSHPDDDLFIPSFSAALIGHLMLGALKAVLIAALLFLASLEVMPGDLDVREPWFTALAIMIPLEVLTTIVERIFIRREHHPAPGSPLQALIVMPLPLLVALAVALTVQPGPAEALAVLAATVVVYGIDDLALTQPWKPRLDRQQWRERTSRIREQLGDERGQDGDDAPPGSGS